MSKNSAKSRNSQTLAEHEAIDRNSFGGDYEVTIVEQWKTCVDAANTITEKRNTANSIFITINTALFTVISFSLNYRSMLLSAVGVLICILWHRLLNNYKLLNEAKYSIINEIEEMLPLRPFTTEWQRLQCQDKYTGLTNVEKAIPIVFIVLYGLAICWPMAKLVLPLICQCTTS